MIADDQNLARLMALAQAGDGLAYRAVLETAQRWLKRYFTGRIAPSMVDDLVQETLLAIHHKRASFDASRPFLPWLAAIARYRWVDQLRRTYRHPQDALDDDIAIDSGETAMTAQISLDRLLAMLPKAQAIAIQLVKIEGCSIAEAAAKSGQSEPSVKVNIHRGLKRLAAHIESE